MKEFFSSDLFLIRGKFYGQLTILKMKNILLTDNSIYYIDQWGKLNCISIKTGEEEFRVKTSFFLIFFGINISQPKALFVFNKKDG